MKKLFIVEEEDKWEDEGEMGYTVYTEEEIKQESLAGKKVYQVDKLVECEVVIQIKLKK